MSKCTYILETHLATTHKGIMRSESQYKNAIMVIYQFLSFNVLS